MCMSCIVCIAQYPVAFSGAEIFSSELINGLLDLSEGSNVVVRDKGAV